MDPAFRQVTRPSPCRGDCPSVAKRAARHPSPKSALASTLTTTCPLSGWPPTTPDAAQAAHQGCHLSWVLVDLWLVPQRRHLPARCPSPTAWSSNEEVGQRRHRRTSWTQPAGRRESPHSIHPCRAGMSTAMLPVHWPCTCYPTIRWGVQRLDGGHLRTLECTASSSSAGNKFPSPLKLMIDRLVCADGGNPTRPRLTRSPSQGAWTAGWDYSQTPGRLKRRNEKTYKDTDNFLCHGRLKRTA
jgi:hypothetical protein